MAKFGKEPKLSSQPFFWRPEAFQGRAFPNELPPGEAERDQMQQDYDAATRVLMAGDHGR